MLGFGFDSNFSLFYENGERWNDHILTFYNTLIVISNNVFYVGAKNNFNIVIIISKKLITLTWINNCNVL